jgi:hypothetical protein
MGSFQRAVVPVALVATLLIAVLPVKAAHPDLRLVNGTHWQHSSETEKKCYLIGVANLMSIEYAYQNRDGNPPFRTQTIIQRLYEAVDDETLDSVIDAVDSWYDTNPDKLDRAVLDVIWVTKVEPKLAQAGEAAEPTTKEAQ